MGDRYSFATTERSLPPEYEQFIPLDKSQVNRLLALDELEGFSDGAAALQAQPEPLPDDILAFLRSLEQYRDNEPVEVGEGGAVYRSLLYRSLLFEEPRTFVKSGTLRTRPVYEAQDMITMPFRQLLSLDGGTSQYASARLIWDKEGVIEPGLIRTKYKLQLTADAIVHWYQQREAGHLWQPQQDQTIAGQAAAYLHCLHSSEMDFYPVQAEDFCFAFVYNKTTIKNARRHWRQLAGHESNRFESTTEAITEAVDGKLVTSSDHRVVQAVALRFGLPRTRFLHPESVTKSWPLFWEFKEAAAGVKH